MGRESRGEDEVVVRGVLETDGGMGRGEGSRVRYGSGGRDFNFSPPSPANNPSTQGSVASSSFFDTRVRRSPLSELLPHMRSSDLVSRYRRPPQALNLWTPYPRPEYSHSTGPVTV